MGLRTINLDLAWEFVRAGDPASAARVDLPHGGFLTTPDGGEHWFGECVYRRTVQWKDPQPGERCALQVAAAMHSAVLFVDGQEVARHSGGYLPFEVNVTRCLQDGGLHQLEIRVDNRPTPHVPPGKPFEELDFCWYGGLYRGVELRVYPPVHITDSVEAGEVAGGGIFVRTLAADEERAEVAVRVQVRNGAGQPFQGQVQAVLLLRNREVANAIMLCEVPVDGAPHFNLRLEVPQPALWSPDQPHLHELEVTVRHNRGGVLDRRLVRHGLRRIDFSRSRGFTINGRRYRLRGTNRHQEHPCVGYAVPAAAERRDALRIKAAGFDYVRLSHYPQAPAFLDACDELGIVVMNAIPGWQFIGGESFRQQCRQAARDLIRRDRNHPCVVLWELSLNETAMDQEFMDQMQALGHEEYPGDQMFTCGWIDRFDVYIHSRQHGGIHTWCNGDKALVVAEYGDWEFYATNEGFDQKSGSGVLASWASSRQFRGDGEAALLQQAWNHVLAASDCLSSSAVLDGQWAMFDYARGYAPVRAGVGLMDAFRVPKFSYHFYRSQRDPSDWDGAGPAGPMVFIASYWTPESSRRVTVFSNCEEVELWLSGRCLGRQAATRAWSSQHLPHPPFVFDVPQFEPGLLEAAGFMGGQATCRHRVNTPGPCAQLVLRADEQAVVSPAGCPDLLFVHAELRDAEGVLCVTEAGPLEFTVEGASLVGPVDPAFEAGIASTLVRLPAGGGKCRIRALVPTSGLRASLILRGAGCDAASSGLVASRLAAPLPRP
jgi:beta-galactosidase